MFIYFVLAIDRLAVRHSTRMRANWPSVCKTVTPNGPRTTISGVKVVALVHAVAIAVAHQHLIHPGADHMEMAAAMGMGQIWEPCPHRHPAYLIPHRVSATCSRRQNGIFVCLFSSFFLSRTQIYHQSVYQREINQIPMFIFSFDCNFQFPFCILSYRLFFSFYSLSSKCLCAISNHIVCLASSTCPCACFTPNLA